MTGLGCHCDSLRGAEELIEGRIAHPGLFGAVAGVASCAGRGAAFGFRAANEGHFGQRTCSLMALGAQQEPGDRTGNGRIRLGDDLADNRGAIDRLPGRSAEMGADLPALLVEQVGLGPLEDPFEALSLRFAGIDLDTVRRRFEQQRRAGRCRYQHRVGVCRKACTDGDNGRDGATDCLFHLVSSSLAYFAATASTSTSRSGLTRPATITRVEAG